MRVDQNCIRSSASPVIVLEALTTGSGAPRVPVEKKDPGEQQRGDD